MQHKNIENRYYELAEKWMNGSITPAEEKEFADWYNAGQDTAVAVDMNFAANEIIQRERMMATINWDGRNTLKINALKRRNMVRWAAAAAILLFISIGAYFITYHKPVRQVVQNQIHDIAPGSNKAVLTLANGTKIILNDAQNGKLANQGNTTISKKNGGEIIYDASKAHSAGRSVQYNTMNTPRGGQYHLILADGTNVWLNAASSIKFPTAFTGNDRRVEITGEAYFEVAHNAAKPFRVTSSGQTVEVLGTHFNINAYADEPSVKTTLLEGKVKIRAANNQVRLLQKGQQAVLNPLEFKVTPIETEAAIAWKNGLFTFEDDDIQHIMRMISRWYNVDISYSGPPVDDIFSGSISRFSNASEVLKTLQLTGKVHFKIQGRQIIVSK